MNVYYYAVLVSLWSLSSAVCAQTLTLESAAFSDLMEIPQIYTCEGKGHSPALNWNRVEKAVSYALICEDPDASGGLYVHWIVFNMQPTMTGLPEGATPTLMAALEGKNSKGETGYTPPCPPAGAAHRYQFTLYALDAMMNIPQGSTYQQIKGAMQGHIIAQSTLTGTYQNNLRAYPKIPISLKL